MTYEKLRYVEQLLSNTHKEGLTDAIKTEIELYFKENYGEDALVKPVPVENQKKEDIIKQIKSSHIPENLQEIISKNVEKILGGSQ